MFYEKCLRDACGDASETRKGLQLPMGLNFGVEFFVSCWTSQEQRFCKEFGLILAVNFVPICPFMSSWCYLSHQLLTMNLQPPWWLQMEHENHVSPCNLWKIMALAMLHRLFPRSDGPMTSAAPGGRDGWAGGRWWESLPICRPKIKPLWNTIIFQSLVKARFLGWAYIIYFDSYDLETANRFSLFYMS